MIIRNLLVGYKSALFGLFEFSFETHGIYVLIGNNGSGKTTLLKTLSGLIKPLKGDVLYSNLNIHKVTIQERARLITYVSPNPTWRNLGIRVVDFLETAFFSQQSKIRSIEISIKIKSLLEDWEMETLIHSRLYTLSDGQIQIISLAYAVLQQTPIILFDEPTVFLDIKSRSKFTQLLKQLESKKLLIISSHDLNWITELSDHLIILRKDTSPTYIKGNENKKLIIDLLSNDSKS